VLPSEKEENKTVGNWLPQLMQSGLVPHECGIFVRSSAQLNRPFGMDELLARMRAARNRRLQDQGPAPYPFVLSSRGDEASRHQLQTHGERPVFRVGDLSVDLVRRIVKVGDKVVKLSPKEYDLLSMAMAFDSSLRWVSSKSSEFQHKLSFPRTPCALISVPQMQR
jgi:hypothetical protein